MSLDFMAPGSCPTQQRTGSHSYPVEQAHRPHSSSSERSMVTRRDSSQYRAQYAAYPAGTAQPWTSVNGAHARPSTMPSYDRRYNSTCTSPTTPSGIIRDDPPDHSSDADSPSRGGNTSPSVAEPERREPRLAYGEEERAFIMVCAVLRNMTWKEIETAFRQRFPAGQKRRHSEPGLWPTYPEQERTFGGLTCAYYRIREAWGIAKVRGVPDEMKPEVRNVVSEMIRSMTQFPDLQQWV
ncbi:uncharacterized protein K452DRAFT_285537 [Aplosporella prunicola CBS 121167]|uniref:Uncharacterized protein n=1 Tax=Aplosporella prunicola CBS 121167 TaxID=1176127 RepID=A0A6A6BLL9_9PEZI|nr:uncharacterized protein K452DRAFT_285537 [Aplosporella prunicola CBS 121167]KAF2144293.1 hypothetical protein K452DRAFT_285537 [Aplosporella prunicola CBS 121167]